MRAGRLYRNGSVWSESVERAETFKERLRGLLGRDGLVDGGAMLIERCGAVHTLGMRFTLGLVFLDRAWRVTRLARDVRPGRLAVWGGWRAVRVIEVPAGSRLLDGLAPGDHFAWEG
jgi:uncharacterized protein